MNFSGDNDIRQGGAGRFVLGLLLIAWLNTAAQPCLMAMEFAPDSTLSSGHTVHSGHGEHSPNDSAAPDCGHCPPLGDDQAIPCATGAASDCELFPGYNLDGRKIEKQSKGVSAQTTFYVLIDTLDCSAAIAKFLPHDIKQLKFSGDPPLNIRHCVFLK